METRDRNLMVNRAGGTAGKNSVNFRVSLPAPWIREMGLDEDVREMIITFDGSKIILEKKPTE